MLNINLCQFLGAGMWVEHENHTCICRKSLIFFPKPSWKRFFIESSTQSWFRTRASFVPHNTCILGFKSTVLPLPS